MQASEAKTSTPVAVGIPSSTYEEGVSVTGYMQVVE